MKSAAEQELNKAGLSLPETNSPGANYEAYRVSGNKVYIAGQICKWNGEMVYQGAVEKDVSLDDAAKAAEICALNMLFQLKKACNGNLNYVKKCLKLEVYVNSTAGFSRHASVANGATEVLIKALGVNGQHTRIAVGSISLPGNSTVEICGEFEVRESNGK
jgi:enamine deaminase RidA (YjgF/YER057c/UK114 family)